MKSKEGLWRLSPSGLYGYTECKACFWADNHFKKAPMLPLLLNTAMDSVLKNRYDKYRSDGGFPPEMAALAEQGIKPFENLGELNNWRENRTALRIVDEEVGYALSGKIDDVLVEADGRLIPADYKSSGNAPAEDKQKYYADQLAAYGLMFSKQGFPVSNRANLLHYFVKDKSDGAIEVAFDSHLDLVPIDLEAIERKLSEMVKCLNGPYPGDNALCDKCAYYAGRAEAIKPTRI